MPAKVINIVDEAALATAKLAGLKYVEAGSSKGFHRQRNGLKFYYTDDDGKRVRDKEILDRIASLVLPPAWENVWISAIENSHLQATGYDVRGRKQYRYHPKWSKIRSEHKFDKLYEFGTRLPTLRKQINSDLQLRSLSKSKVCALALNIMMETSIRVGNAAYEKSNGSYGLTTLNTRHVKFTGGSIFFKFKGKKGVLQEIALKRPQLARMLNKIHDLPGQKLFQYYDDDKNLQQLTSDDLNEYIREHVNEQMSCKVVRTWSGCVHFLTSLAVTEQFESQAECKRNIVSAIDGVASKLGNTRTVCKNYYIHPELMNHYEQNKLCGLLQSINKTNDEEQQIAKTEKLLLKFLKSLAA